MADLLAELRSDPRANLSTNLSANLRADLTTDPRIHGSAAMFIGNILCSRMTSAVDPVLAELKAFSDASGTLDELDVSDTVPMHL